MKDKKLLIVGCGSLTNYLLGMLAKNPECPEVVVVGRDPEKIKKAINIQFVGAYINDLTPKFNLRICDVTQEDRLARIISEEKPDVVLNATRYISGVKYGPMSIKHLDCAYGAWMLYALPLSYKVARAVQLSGVSTKLVNTSYSDGVVPVLSKMESCASPVIGIGNVQHLTPRIALAASSRYNVPVENLLVKLVAGHFTNTVVSRYGHDGGSPTSLQIMDRVNGKLLLNNDAEEKEKIFSHCNILIAEGPTRNVMSASSTYRVVREMLTTSNKIFHAPGPNGLIGGYPVVVNSSGDVEVALGKLATKSAEEVNKANIKFDGIDNIDDEAVTLTDKLSDNLSSTIGMSLKSFNHDYVEWIDVGDELTAKLKEARILNA